jgi:hypothetical protein
MTCKLLQKQCIFIEKAVMTSQALFLRPGKVTVKGSFLDYFD